MRAEVVPTLGVNDWGPAGVPALLGSLTAAGYAGTLRGQGLTLAAVAERLNADGFRTRREAAWQPTQVKRMLDRVGAQGKL